MLSIKLEEDASRPPPEVSGLQGLLSVNSRPHPPIGGLFPRPLEPALVDGRALDDFALWPGSPTILNALLWFPAAFFPTICRHGYLASPRRPN